MSAFTIVNLAVFAVLALASFAVVVLLMLSMGLAAFLGGEATVNGCATWIRSCLLITVMSVIGLVLREHGLAALIPCLGLSITIGVVGFSIGLREAEDDSYVHDDDFLPDRS